ncbi:hypothetical protein F5148DRAFT_1287579 [Russula earlei]|uniref:Uncharacterized protein n=1 Tax=Russula earlei TaxID=71964 RepID=A0ACC0U283_9AGAM|nr:hypothetical protein F5148DRAFT_1287579 [Russula earlei]
MLPQPPSPIVSSSSTLWATASKEWVIPAKPKPGRKPKKDSAPPSVQQNDVPDANGRRVQNRYMSSVDAFPNVLMTGRAAQRAFRERKQSLLAELQARIQLYEQGEVERNVAIQTVAKRLKEENDNLRSENAQLKEMIANYEREYSPPKPEENKRWRDDPSAPVDDQNLPKKKSKLDAIKSPSSLQVHTSNTMTLTTSSTPSQVSSLRSNISSEPGPSSLPSPAARADVMFPPASSTLENINIFNFPPDCKASAFNGIHSMGAFECGLCMDGTSCVCREMALNPPSTSFKAETTEPAPALVPVTLPPASQIGAQSILDNLPPYQPPVPLRRRPEVRPLRSFFPVVPLSGNLSQVTQTSQADCSGDPSNCLACADDVFGQAFCAAVGESLAAGGPCADCPRGTKCTDNASSNASREGGNRAEETIPTSDAWRRLKSHPNVSFADLTLLAEVVARRSKCTGPTVVISPPPGSVTPERAASPVAPSEVRPAATSDNDVILLSDPHALYHEKERERSACPSPELAPKEELIRCSRTRSVRKVHAAGVREALALLDSRFRGRCE